MIMSRRDRAVLTGLGALALAGFVGLGGWVSAGDPDVGPRPVGSGATLAALEAMAQNEPEKVENFTRLGEAYKASGRLGDAVSAYVSAAQLAPRDPEVQRALVSLKAMAEAKGRH
jgi:hypothetical protein